MASAWYPNLSLGLALQVGSCRPQTTMAPESYGCYTNVGAVPTLEIPLQWHRDVELMWLFVQSGWQQPKLLAINQCQMYLKVFLLSEIVCSKGIGIVPQFWDHYLPSESHLDWPDTSQPSLNSWAIWCQALSTSLHLGQNQQLAIPLGKWYAPTQPNRWYYHPQTMSLWEATAWTWIQHGGIPQWTWQIGFHGTGEPHVNELEKATIVWHGTKIILTGQGLCNPITQGIDPCQQMWMTDLARQWELELHLMGHCKKNFCKGMGTWLVMDPSRTRMDPQHG